ncbi:MAG: hypothetical protein MUF22_07470 [Chitinispirillaceae bacterium]|jgi:hypothetical protein|nr:hypothetical protein [Chitinispirillaceae bacterium]
MKATHHIALSFAASAATYAISRSTTMTAASLLSGVLLDLDHCVDYIREYGIRLDIGHFFHAFNNTLFKKIVLPLHAWELVLLLAGLVALNPHNAVFTGLLIGTAHHMIADQLHNKSGKWGYFFLYRLKQGFICSKILPGKGLA